MWGSWEEVEITANSICMNDKIKPGQPPFMGNYFCLLHNHNAAFVIVAKNACTFLKQTAVVLRRNKILQDANDLHDEVGFEPRENKGSWQRFSIGVASLFHGKGWKEKHFGFNYLVPVSKMSEYEKTNGRLVKFAVYRDPVERFIANYKHFVLDKTKRRYFNYIGLYNDKSFERFVQFAEFELGKSHVEYQDEHIRRQSDYYKPQDVDYIVPIEKLNLFLSEKGIPMASSTKINASSSSTPEGITQELKDRVKKLYNADYSIKVNY